MQEENNDLSEEPTKKYRYPPTGLKGLLFWGIGDLVSYGYNNSIKMDDLWRLEKDIESSWIWDAFSRAWTTSAGSVTRAIWTVYKVPLTIQMVRHFVMAVLQFTAVVMIPSLINWLQDTTVPAHLGPTYVAIIIGAIFCQRFLMSQGNAHAFKIMCQIQSNMMLAIYEKTLVLAPSRDQDTGKLMSLMGSDTNTIAWTLPALLEAPVALLRVLAVVGVMWTQIGPYCLISIGVLVLMLPITAKLGSKTHEQIKIQKQATDSRVKLINELVQGIRLVKFYAWERFFQDRIEKSREEELARISKMLTLQLVMQFFLMVTPVLVTSLTFITYGATREMTLSTALTTLALINALRNDFVSLPPVVTGISQWRTSANRIEELLGQPEISIRPEADLSRPPCIKVSDGLFRWGNPNDPDSSVYELSDIDIDIKRSSLTVVLGSVASGKSTLAAAILGEVPRISGEVVLHGRVAYVPQQPWIINATVRDNILLGRPYDPKFFQHVVEICELVPDLEGFPAGDLTEIGERGVNTSGGQRARISLARAVYSQADIYILDDPLSAVDSRIALYALRVIPFVSGFDLTLHNLSAIFQDVIRTELKDKIVFLICNQLQYAPEADNVIVMDKGRIRSSGKFDQIMSKDSAFAQLMTDHGIDSSTAGTDSKSGTEDSSSDDSISLKGQGKSGALVREEESEKGRVALSVFSYYAKAAGLLIVAGLFLFRGTVSVMNATAIWWLSFWTTDITVSGKPLSYYVGVYSGLNITEAVFMLFFLLTMTSFLYRSGKFLHEKCLAGVIRAPTSFFDSTPMGRVIARFSVDFSTIDIQMAPILILVFVSSFGLVATLFSMSLGAPWMLIAAIPATIFCFAFQRYYQLASIQVKRLESKSKAPIYSHFGETISGSSSIRAFGILPQFRESMDKKVDENNICVMGNRFATSWFNLRISMVVLLIQAAAYIVTVSMRLFGTLNVSLAAITISLTPQLTTAYIQATNQFTQFEARMNSIERVRDYALLKPEAPEVLPESRPPRNWPAEGRIEFDDFCMKYGKVDTLALKNVSFSVKPRERVGIVGRSGAGKSSMMLALFRMVERLSGKIVIDGVDISTIGLNDLRTKLTIIPQEPLLFAGNVRYNLDPFERFGDRDLWDVLETVNLKEYVNSLPGKLEAVVEEGGRNFSVGQRQLICMARSLLSRARILLLDEASASLDPVTDSLIQRTIRSSFPDSTILVIAHKIQTVVDLDRILVMSNGSVVEYDTPLALLSNKSSVFSAMVDATGENMSKHIRSQVFS